MLLACIIHFFFIKLGRRRGVTSEVKTQAEVGVTMAGTARLARLHKMAANDPMRANAPHFATPALAAAIFESRARGGLGITLSYEMLRASIVAVGHLQERPRVGTGGGEWDWVSSFAELRAEHPGLVDTARGLRGGRAAVMAEV